MAYLAEALEAIRELGPEGGIDRFATSLPPEWIEEALAVTGTASLRRRKLPAEHAVWLVLGMALFTDRSIRDVVDHLGLVIGHLPSLAPSNVSKARYRLGSEPIRWLFNRVAQKWSATPGLGDYRGLSLWGVDGTHLRVQDSEENFAHFGKPGGRAGSNDAGYPQMRVAALMNLSNRLLADARAGPWSTSELELASELWKQVPDDSLTIIDRGFMSYMVLLELVATGRNRHFLIRAKKGLRYEPVEVLADGTVLALLMPNKNLRRKEKDVPGPIEVRVVSYRGLDGSVCQLFTTLTDCKQYPADDIIELYHDRWELEIGFDEVKTHMLERKECLRSKKPDGVYQELWAQLLVYNLVRREMLLAAKAHELPARRISFRSSLMWIRNFWITAWLTSPGNVPKSLAEFRSTLDVLILPERRSERRYPRHVKIKMSSYPRNRGRNEQHRKELDLKSGKPAQAIDLKGETS
ncbi:MAG: IS4 family transposase [Spirochaetales bacterium]